MTFDRACEHLDAFDHATTEWGKISAHLVSEERDRNVFEQWGPPRPGRVIPPNAIGVELIFRERYPIQRNWSLILNEALHGFRSCLDQLVYALGCAHQKGPLTDKMAAGSEFPIYWDKAPSTAILAKKIGAIHPKAQAIIEGLQPHHDTNFRLNKLWVLHELDRIGKHRLLPVLGANTTQNFVTVPVVGAAFQINRMAVTTGPVKDGTPIGWYVLVPTNPSGKVKVDFTADIQPVLGDGLPSLGTAWETLTAIRDEIQGVVFARLEKFLKP